jgi:glycosyltransferase involved in cell wall biosynthesis
MKFSIITVCYNSEKTIEDTIQSVLSQTYTEIEYIIIDGCSNDNTMLVVNRYKDKISKILSEPDLGIYDAINKGIKISTGDIVGILNSDDKFSNNNIIEIISNTFSTNSFIDIVIGNVVFIDSKNNIKRSYSAKNWTPDKFIWGFMPPHPSFYCKRIHYDNFGYYRTDFKIGSDYELLIRFFKINNLRYKYIDIVMVMMKLGGVSTRGFSSLFKINKEILVACKINGLRTNYFMIYSKYFFKFFEFFKYNYADSNNRI